MKNILKILGKKGSFRQNALIMSSGAIANIFISFVLYPIITRMYSEEDIGLLGHFLSVITILGLISTTLYPTAFVIPKLKREFYSLLKLSLILSGTSIFLISLITFIFPDVFHYVFKTESFGKLLYLIPIALIISLFNNIITNWNVRNKMFKHNASSNVGTALTSKISNIVIALSKGPSAIGLIISHLISLVIGTYLLGTFKLIRKINILKRINNSEVKNIASQYKKYPLNLLPGNLINRYTNDLPIYLLTAYFNPAITGAFVLANQMLNIPLNVLGSSISTVFIQHSNQLHNENKSEFQNLISKMNIRMVFLGALSYGTVFAYGDLLFPFVFGSKWKLAGQFASILSIYFIFRLASSPLSGVFRVVHKEHYSLIVSISLVVFRCIALYYGLQSENSINLILYFTIGSALGYFFTLILVFRSGGLNVIKQSTLTIGIAGSIFLFLYLTRIPINYFIQG